MQLRNQIARAARLTERCNAKAGLRHLCGGLGMPRVTHRFNEVMIDMVTDHHQIEAHDLIGKSVYFQTDHASYGEGQVIEVHEAIDAVTVLEKDTGARWKGSMDHVEVVD